MSIVTNIDFEHSDCYENIESLKETFLSFKLYIVLWNKRSLL